MDTTLAAGPHCPCRRGRSRFSAACVLPAVAAAVPVLRRLARRTARRWDLPDDAADALGLIVTELVTNAVRHSGSPDVTLLLCVADEALTVQVKDSGTWRPRFAPPGARGRSEVSTACGGRGLLLVEAYAASCTVRRSGSGTAVTAELLLAEPVPEPATRPRREPELPPGPARVAQGVPWITPCADPA